MNRMQMTFALVAMLSTFALSSGSTTSPGPAAALTPDNCVTHCTCDLQEPLLDLTSTLPACVSAISATYTSPSDGCCFDAIDACTAASCGGKITITIFSTPGLPCRKTITPEGGPPPSASGTGDVEYQEEFSLDCGGTRTYSLSAGANSATFGTYTAKCRHCDY